MLLSHPNSSSEAQESHQAAFLEVSKAARNSGGRETFA